MSSTMQSTLGNLNPIIPSTLFRSVSLYAQRSAAYEPRRIIILAWLHLSLYRADLAHGVLHIYPKQIRYDWIDV